MSLSNYPPGHPTGTSHGDYDAVCVKCGTKWSYDVTTEADTNASYPTRDGDDCCPECGHPDGEPYHEDSEPDPEDTIEAARVHAWPALMALGARIETIAAVDAAGRMA